MWAAYPEPRMTEAAESASLTWRLETGGKRAWVCFEDDKTYDLGSDEDGTRFEAISQKMLGGDYYPDDSVAFSGRFRDEKRSLQVGDRVVQEAPLLGRLGGPKAIAVVEMSVAEKSESSTQIGYVTTEIHFGRGIWQANLTREDGRLSLRVFSTVCPNSLWYWIGLPYARYLQLRARRRAVEEFLKL